MAATSGIIKDSSGNDFYPLTHADVTYLQDNTTVETAINSIRNAGYISTGDVGTITAQNLGSGSVTYDKVNWNSMKPVWSRFVFSSNVGMPAQEIVRTTKLGTQLTFFVTNGGTAMLVLDGGEAIDFMRQMWVSTFASVTSNYGVYGVASGSTVWTYATGGSNGGTYFNSSARTSTVASGVNYADLAGTIGGAKGHTMANLTLIRRSPNDTTWFMSGKMHSSGSSAYVDFQSELTSMGSGVIPTTYQRGATSDSVTSIKQVFEVLEYV